jgi:hypothetical protein
MHPILPNDMDKDFVAKRVPPHIYGAFERFQDACRRYGTVVAKFDEDESDGAEIVLKARSSAKYADSVRLRLIRLLEGRGAVLDQDDAV